MFEALNDDNFILFAMKHYDNPQCVTSEEFYSDLNRIQYVKKLFKRYYCDDDLRERLILNHLVIFYNVFGIQAANRMMFFKTDEEHHSILKTFLLYLNYIKDSDYVDIPLDFYIVDRLREIG